MPPSLLVQSTAANCRSGDDTGFSLVLRREGLLRWLRLAKSTVYICRCGQVYRHLWRGSLSLILSQRHALWRYLDRVYARVTEAKRSVQVI